MAWPKSDLLSWDGSWHEIAKAISNAVLAQSGTDEDVRRILKDKKLAVDIAKLLIAARPGAVSEPVKPMRSPLIGTVVKSLRLQPYKVSSFAGAIKLGKYDGVSDGIATMFADDEVGLTDPVNVDLVEFDRDTFVNEGIEWGASNGKKPMLPQHLLAIGIQHHEEQRLAPIVELGSIHQGVVLYLHGGSYWRCLNCYSVEGSCYRGCRFGFLS